MRYCIFSHVCVPLSLCSDLSRKLDILTGGQTSNFKDRNMGRNTNNQWLGRGHTGLTRQGCGQAFMALCSAQDQSKYTVPTRLIGRILSQKSCWTFALLGLAGLWDFISRQVAQYELNGTLTNLASPLRHLPIPLSIRVTYCLKYIY